jgi:hypothetical protein
VNAIVQAPPVATADATIRPGPVRIVLALARVEGGRLIRHPIVLGGTVLSLGAFVMATWWTAPVLQRDDILTGVSLMPLAGSAFFVANLAVLRSRRHGTDELYQGLVATPSERTVAHLLSVAWVVAMAIAVVGAYLGYEVLEGAVGAPRVAELAVGPAIVALVGALGVAVARWWPSIFAPAVTVVALAALQLFLQVQLMSGQSVLTQPRWLALWVPLSSISSVAPELVIRPAWWHLLYLLGAGGLFAALAVIRAGGGRRVIAVMLVSLAVVGVSAAVQLRPPSAAQRGVLLAKVRHPDRYRVCEVRSGVRYCVFPGYRGWIDRWAATLTPVVSNVPPKARSGIEVGQVLSPFYGGDLPRAAALAMSDTGQPQFPYIQVGVTWGRGPTARRSELSLALQAAIHILGFPSRNDQVLYTTGDIRRIARTLPASDQRTFLIETHAGDVAGFCVPRGQARAVMALWLAGSATRGTATEMRMVEHLHPYGIVGSRGHVSYDGATQVALIPYLYELNTFAAPPIDFPAEEAAYAVQLLDRPASQVRSVLDAHWAEFADPSTPTADLLRAFGIRPFPSVDEQLRRAGVPPTSPMRAEFRNAILAEVPCR